MPDHDQTLRLLTRPWDEGSCQGPPGKDALDGEKGKDKLTADKDVNRYKGGAGNDSVNAKNSKKETVDCGPAKKATATVDEAEKIKGCETVKREEVAGLAISPPTRAIVIGRRAVWRSSDTARGVMAHCVATSIVQVSRQYGGHGRSEGR